MAQGDPGQPAAEVLASASISDLPNESYATLAMKTSKVSATQRKISMPNPVLCIGDQISERTRPHEPHPRSNTSKSDSAIAGRR